MRCNAGELKDVRAPQECAPTANGRNARPPDVTASGGVFVSRSAGAEKLIPSPPLLILDKEVVTLHDTKDWKTPKEEIHAALVKKIARGLRRLNENELKAAEVWLRFESFKRCGQDSGAVLWCGTCDTERALKWQCSKKWCPLCNWKITEMRREKLLAFSKCVNNPQHLVLTQRNFKHLSPEKFREHRKNLVKIRRNKIWAEVKGGCTSVELTNKGEGWHLHSHSLIDARWIDAGKLAIEWGKLCGQEFGIVHRSKIDSIDYEKEICKYVVKPADLIKWRTCDLLEFIKSIHRNRFFFTFGTMKNFKTLKQPHEVKCDCCKETNTSEFMPAKNMTIDAKMKFMSHR